MRAFVLFLCVCLDTAITFKKNVLKALRAKARQIDLRCAFSHEISHNARGRRRLRQTVMAMTESIEDIRRGARTADHGQGIGDRGPMPHPHRALFKSGQVTEETLGLLMHGAGAFVIGRQFQSAQFHRTTNPQAGIERGRHEAMALERHGTMEMAVHAGKGDVVAALGIQWHVIAERCRDRFRPSARRHNGAFGEDRFAAPAQ